MIKTQDIDTKSVRVFGYIWATILAVFWLHQYRHSDSPSTLLLIAAASFLAISVFYPRLFCIAGVYQGWIKFGGIIGKINSMIILSALFFVVFTPIGLFFRLIKKDLLCKKLDKQCESYFIRRQMQPINMENQF